MNLANSNDLVQTIRSCPQAHELFTKLIGAQDQLLMGLSPQTQKNWATALEAFMRHLAEHHGCLPSSQAEADQLMQWVEPAAEQLGL